MVEEPGGPRDVILRPKYREDFHGKDFYQILGLRKEDKPTRDEIRKAYKSRARELHPDAHLEEKKYYEELFKSLLEAQEVLTDESRRALYDMDMSDIFAAAANHAEYYKPAAQKDLYKEYYRSRIAWLVEIYKQEREHQRDYVYSKAVHAGYKIREQFPDEFKYRNQSLDTWVYEQIDWGKLVLPDPVAEGAAEYPKGKKTPEQLLQQELEKLGIDYRRGLENMKANFRERAQDAAKIYFQPMPKDRKSHRTKDKQLAEKYLKEFRLGQLSIQRRADDLYHIIADGEELPETHKELIWESDYLIGENEQGKKYFIDLKAGQRISELYDNLEIKEVEGEIVVIAKSNNRYCLLDRHTGQALTATYESIFIAGDRVFAFRDQGGVVALERDDSGNYSEQEYE